MSEKFRNHKIDENLDDIAISWYLLLEAGMTKQEEVSFNTWLSQSPKHKEIFDETCRLFGKIDSLDKNCLEALKEENKQKSSNNSSFNGILSLAIVACALFLFIGVTLLSQNFFNFDSLKSKKNYFTAFGEKKEFNLEDGSKIFLDSNSKLEVAFYKDTREVKLKKGRVLFEVSHDKLRPFIIYSGFTRVKVLGTSFVLEYANNATKISVKSGKVQIARLEENTTKLALGRNLYLKELEIGEQALLNDNWETPKFSKINTQQIGLWKEGRVEFDNTPLELAIKEFSRYSKLILIIEDKSLKTLPIMGSFDLNRLDAFIQALEMIYEVKAIKQKEKIVLKKANL